jgi:broad specificity phosphatase PhoE
MKPLIILVRHGSTALNAKSHGDSSERIRGWADIPLDSEGKKEAERIAKNISSNYQPQEIHSSPLIRALETANSIADACHLSVEKTTDLLPWNLGDFTGQRVSLILKEMKYYVSHPERQVPGGEPFDVFKKRFLIFLKAEIHEAFAKKWRIVLVSHTRDCQVAKAWIAAGCPDDFSIDDKTMDDYSNETVPGGFLIIGAQ